MESWKSSKNCNITECPNPGLLTDGPDASTLHVYNASTATDPFWNEVSASNPFLDDITQMRNNQKRENISILKEDPFIFFREVETGNSFDSSGDELDVHQLLRQSSSRKSGRSKSVSELLDILDYTAHAHQNIHNSGQILEQDLEWLQNDREAYKMAWLSQHQLVRSCLELNTINQSPGWAQTQVAETMIVCKLNHRGGSIQLPESDITIHVPQGHVAMGEFQEVEPPDGRPVTQFFVTTPSPAPKLKRLLDMPGDLQEKEIKAAPLLPTLCVKYPTFQDKKLNFTNYGVTLKTVLRQNKIDYLLEYLKGDAVALLGEGKIKAIGQSKVKEWYVGILRGKIGLVHCKNVKLIGKEQVMSMTDSVFTTRNLLEQIALPFKKLTYIYSVVLTLVSEKVYDWKVLADVLGYSHLALEDFGQIQADKESEKVSYVVKKLKEDCHAGNNTRKFLYELTMALLKMDCQGLVAHLIREAALLTSAVKLGKGWRELAEKLVGLTKQQMEAFEIPHQGKAGDVTVEMWKPAYDFLYTWGAHYGNSYRDVLQDLQSALDRMKNPVTKQWRDLTGALILVNSLEVLRATAFSTSAEV
ncbi:Metastasis-Associated In Colon Cancer Protein 1 [Manis pentadactyla]|nr:Metastasis-Associated In Colon Cancer Protein 1 [Manis pentadactyla]